MSWSLRRAVLLVVATAVLGSAAFLPHGYAQKGKAVRIRPGVRPVQPPGPVPSPEGVTGKGGEQFSSVTLPSDNAQKEQIIAAGDYIKDQDWETATRILVKLLKRDEDVFAELPSKGADGKERLTWLSVRKEADRLLARLPKEGMEFYRIKYGPDADDMLKRAKENSDPRAMAYIMRVYLNTDAGAEAANWLATYNLDRGEYLAAALAYKRLLSRDGADRLSPVTLFKAAYAFHQAEQKKDEDLVWKQFQDRGIREVKLRNETRTLEELQDYVAQLKRSGGSQNQNEAPWFRGNLARDAQYPGGTAFMVPHWKVSSIHATSQDSAKPVLDKIQTAENSLRQRGQPVMTSFFPVTATVVNKGTPKSLLLFRSHYGIHAVVMKTGKLEWEASSTWSLERMLVGEDGQSDSRKLQAVTQWLNQYNAMQRPEILFDNSNTGTLSSDGTVVYAIEDFQVPPPYTQQFNQWGQPNGNNQFGEDLSNAIDHNRLQVYHLGTGKLIAEVGDKGGKDPLSDTFFLGPPLPLSGRAYVLTEKQQELSLTCLEPQDKSVKVVFQQRLGTVKEKLQNDVTRRTHAAHLAYGEGILVCPTNAGTVFGVDLQSNSFLWAYHYREQSDAAAAMPQPPNPWGGRPGWPPQNQTPGDSWKVSAPVIQDGKVVFTAPDARSIHCVNLRDGAPLWSRKRTEDDLYLAGVFGGKVLIVGKKNCRALSLTKGEQLWSLPTGLPSGQGVASDNIYYLPLQEAAKTKLPEICAIDVEKGEVAAHTQSRSRGGKPEVPGNLLFYDGYVLSQTPTEVVSYPQLKVKIAEMDALLAKNPDDPVGLTERGELRLDKGDLPGAIEDLRKALKNKPPERTRDKARAKLYDSLTEYFQRDFNNAEEYLKEYEELCKVDMGGAEGAERAKLEAEQRRRKANFLCLVAKGREGQGKLKEAFERYQEFVQVARKDGDKEELISVVDEPAVRVAPDVWSGGRIRAMMEKATEEQRRPLEEMIARRWKDLQGSGSLDDLKHFVSMFGANSAVGKEARLRLAERLAEQDDPRALLEAEQQAQLLRGPDEKPEVAARAVEALARMNTRQGLIEDAAYYYRLLARDYPNVKVRDGKTGAEIYKDLDTDKRFYPYRRPPTRFSVQPSFNMTQEGGKPYFNQSYTFGQSGEALPFFRKNQFVLTYNGPNHVKMVDADTGKEQWESNVSPTMMQFLTYTPNGRDSHRIHHRYQNVGHLVVLTAGNMVFGIDPLAKGEKKVLWEKDLWGRHKGVVQPVPGMPMPGQQNPMLTVDPRDGSYLVTWPGGWVQRLGEAGPLQAGVLCVQTYDALVALDPVSGRTLWSRSDVARGSHIFGDGQTVYVVETGSDHNAASTRAFRAYDGVSVKVPDFAALYQKRVRMVGRNILLSEKDDGGAVVLRLYDVRTGKDAWKQTYPANSVLLRPEDEGHVGVVEPDGTVRVTEVAGGKEVLKAKVEMKYLEKAESVHLLADPWNFYVAVNGPGDPKMAMWNGGVVQTNLMPGSGLHAVPVNGEVYAFERGTGKMKWHNPVLNQMIVLNHFREMPILLCTSRYIKMNPGMGGQWYVAVKALQKRTGKLLSEKEELANQQQYHALHVDARAGKIELVSSSQTLVFQVDRSGARKDRGISEGPTRGEKGGVEPAPATPQGGAAPPPARIRRINRFRTAEEVNPLPR